MTSRITLLLAILILPFLTANTARAAAAPGCFETFYKTKNHDCVAEMVQIVRNYTPSTQNLADHSTLEGAAGFFAEYFRTFPTLKEKLLKADMPIPGKSIYVEALYRAGLKDEAKAYADKNGLVTVYAQYQAANLPAVADLLPTARAADNDVLIGAYSASGNVNYIRDILGNYTDATDEMAANALRIGMMSSKFGFKLDVPKRKPETMQALCAKYQCRTNPHDMLRVMTMASAFWALRDIASRDEQLKSVFLAFFKNDPRLSNILQIESNGFSNYVLTVVMYGAGISTPGMNNGLQIYESLGPADSVGSYSLKKKS